MAVRRFLPARRPRKTVDASLPIVNVILMLIFFFLASGRFMSESLDAADLRPPRTQDLAADALPMPVLVVRADDRFDFEGQTIALEEIGAATAGAPSVNILIDRDEAAGRLARILSQIDLSTTQPRIVTLDGGGSAPP